MAPEYLLVNVSGAATELALAEMNTRIECMPDLPRASSALNFGAKTIKWLTAKALARRLTVLQRGDTDQRQIRCINCS